MRCIVIALAGLLAIPISAAEARQASNEDLVQTVSILGRDLLAMPDEGEEVAIALEEARQDPENPERWMRVGLLYAATWRYNEAIDAYSRGLQIDPMHALLYRHRGHRWISLRFFDLAAADLELSARLDPSNWDTWYHLGLAYYLLGEYERAEKAYRKCLALSDDDGRIVAVSDWLWMTLKRNGDDAGAAGILEPIRADMEVGENTAYHRRLLLYKGLLSEQQLMGTDEPDPLMLATYGYGLGNYYFISGRPEEAIAVFERVVAGTYWPAFGYIAAEADLYDWR